MCIRDSCLSAAVWPHTCKTIRCARVAGIGSEAEPCESTLAIFAKTTRNIEWHTDPISPFDAVDRAADLDDRSKILMPEDSAGLHISPAFIHMQIRAADVRGCDFHKHIGCFFNLGIRDIFDDYVARTFINDCFHEDSPLLIDVFRLHPYLLLAITAQHSTYLQALRNWRLCQCSNGLFPGP